MSLVSLNIYIPNIFWLRSFGSYLYKVPSFVLSWPLGTACWMVRQTDWPMYSCVKHSVNCFNFSHQDLGRLGLFLSLALFTLSVPNPNCLPNPFPSSLFYPFFVIYLSYCLSYKLKALAGLTWISVSRCLWCIGPIEQQTVAILSLLWITRYD